MSAFNLKFVNVTFSYNTSIEPVVSSLSVHFSKGWTGIVGPNGVGKSTVAKLAAGILKPVSGSVIYTGSQNTLYCEQDTSEPPENAFDFESDMEPYSGKIRSILGIENGWLSRWNTLSHGERKRYQIGHALWSEPDFLILDEPINHVDRHTRELILSSLLIFDGTGIIVSHERSFLDSLCHDCLFMRPGYAVLRRGNFTEGYRQQQLEDETRENDYSIARTKYLDIKKRAAALKQKETGKSGRLSKRNIAIHDHDAKGKIDAARLTGKDKSGARKAIVLEKRAKRIGDTASSLYFSRRKVEGIMFHGEKSRRDYLAKIDSQNLPLGPDKRLTLPDLQIFPEDRIALTGNNGTGKSTLVRFIIPLIRLNTEQILYIPQEIDEDLWKTVQDNLKALEGKLAGEVFSAVHRLGSEPERVIYSDRHSPGEKRKIMLALGLLKKPSIIMMDEPTNHMDIPSIQCIETALRQFTGALLIVSHDPVFIENTTETIWEISDNGKNTELKIILR